VDFITMQVKFNQGAEMFERLHELAHWVVTLDAFIGRAQIELLHSSPDVILLRPRVGKNHSYNLVVSSKTGREFVTGRLGSRLKVDFPERSIDELPELLYDRGRALFPGLVLRSLGLGWAVQELIGLVVAHSKIGRDMPTEPQEGFQAWISLDEQPSWFGAGQVRADLARITAVKTEEGLQVSVLVVESKFRKAEDVNAADDQVSNSLELLRNALAPEGRADGRFWRRQVLDVAEQSSRRADSSGAVAALSCWGPGGLPTTGISPELRSMWLEGDYELLDVGGLVCTMSSALAPGLAGTHESPGGHTWYRLDANVIWEVLEELIDGSSSRVVEELGEARDDSDAIVDSTDVERIPETPAVAVEGDGEESETTDEPLLPEDERRGNLEALERRYQEVLNVFTEYKVLVSRPEEDAFNEGPGFYVFRVKPAPGVKPDSIMKLAPELKLKLGLEKDLNPKSYIDSGAVVFEVPKADEDRYYVTADSIWERTEASTDKLFAPIGEDINGAVVGIDFSSSDSPHLLVAGMTGSGKSIALETILQGLCRSHGKDRLRLGLVDPKGTELNDFEDDPRLLGQIGMYAEDAVELLQRAVQEMDDRRHAFRSVRARNLPEFNKKAEEVDRLPWWVIVLDEYADLTSDKDERKEIEDSLKRLSQKARASGIHVIVATQKPSAEVISTTVRSNLPAQLALRVKTGSDSRVILDEGGAEALAGKGDALFKTVHRTVRIQCAAVSEGL
jgi:DNA segregation ATPase FtsK/SpoIIIE, S-DNA-T family